VSAARKVLAVAAVDTRRFGRDRMNLFFVLLLPLAIILAIGLQFGDETPRLGVVGGGSEPAEAVLDELPEADDVEVVAVDDADELADRVDAGDLAAGVVFAADRGAHLAAGEPVEIGFVAGTTPAAQQLRSSVDRALVAVAAVPTAERAAVERGADPAEAAAAAERLAPTVERVQVRRVSAGDRLFPEDIGGYDVAAPSQLVLFTFLTGLAGSSALIEARKLGLTTRVLATPTSPRVLVAGQALGRLLICLVQAVYILVVTLLVFGVDWGDPLGATAVVLGMASVSAAAAMCFGTFLREPEQANGVGVVVALALAALGGAMLPIELFGDTLATVARVTPHYWAVDAFAELVRHDGTLLDIGTQLAVLAVFAVVLLLAAAWRLRGVMPRAR
jgi:ABC-2 type transport system permease protein